MDLAEVQNGGWELIFPCFPHNLAHPSPAGLPPKHPGSGGAPSAPRGPGPGEGGRKRGYPPDVM